MAIRIKEKGAVMITNEQRKYDESIVRLENILGKEELAHLTKELTSRYGDKLEAKVMSAVHHIEHTYSPQALGEILENDDFTNLDKITEWADAGERPQLKFESMSDDADIEPNPDNEDYDDGLDFPSMDD